MINLRQILPTMLKSFLYFEKRKDLQYRYMTYPFTSNNYERWFLDGGDGKLKHTTIIFREFPESPLWTPFLHLPPPLCYFRIQYEGSRVHPTWRVALWNGVSPYRMGGNHNAAQAKPRHFVNQRTKGTRWKFSNFRNIFTTVFYPFKR